MVLDGTEKADRACLASWQLRSGAAVTMANMRFL
jgi:hypothetical protein